MQHVIRPTRERAVIDRAYNLSHGGVMCDEEVAVQGARPFPDFKRPHYPNSSKRKTPAGCKAGGRFINVQSTQKLRRTCALNSRC